METPVELDHLPEEQVVFIDCIADVLAVTPGCRWHVVTDPEQLLRWNVSAFAVFIIDTNPAANMTMSIELGERTFGVVINGAAIRQRRKSGAAFERWIDQCARLITRMTEGDLKLTVHRLAGTPYRWTLSVQRGRRQWHELLKRESHAGSVMGYLLPFGIGLALSGEQELVFRDWANADAAADSPLPDEDATAEHGP